MRNFRAKLSALAIALFALGFWTIAFAQNADSNFQTNLPTLTQIEQIHQLSLSEARRHRPVKLRGVLLGLIKPGSFVLLDQTGGVHVWLATNQTSLQGQLVEISGTTDTGGFAPIVVPTGLQVLGEGKLPPPQDVSFRKIAGGTEDCQWVRISGIVRSASPNFKNQPTVAELTLATDGEKLDVIVNDYHGERLEPLVDSEVAITGLVGSIFNGKHELISVRLMAPGTKFIEVRRSASRDPWTAPSRSIAGLRQFSPEKPSGHRVKVQGVVTLQQPGNCIFIRDQTGSICVETKQKDLLSPGDRVEALGFPVQYAPLMEDAVFRKTGVGAPAAPIALSARKARRTDYDANLICVEGQLLDQFETPDQLVLILQDGDILFRALLPRAKAKAMNIRNGAQLRVTGICQTQFVQLYSPRALQMLLRSPADLVVLREPSWWTPSRMRWALCILVGALLGVGIWVWTLKQQVNSQTKAICEKIEREAILRERVRIAREFHDSLEQELAGVRMQLELTAATVANSPQTAAASLQMARTMISHSQAEARRSVWELRSQVLENRTLPAALSAAVGSLENGAPIEVNISGQTRALPMRIESNLLRIAQEAITNATKHAKPRHISVHLNYETDGARLKICDDGCGFCVDNAPDGQTGHFGLLGMRERVDKIAGTLDIASVPGKGTSVEVFVPQSANDIKSA